MTNPLKGALVIGGIVAFVAVTGMRSGTDSSQCGGSGCLGLCTALLAAEVSPAGGTSMATATNAVAKKPLPRLVDLGANKCIPCKKMAPILEELKASYAGQLEVEFIDVWKNPEAGKPYKIQLIPTQIFFDAAGKELYRHQGFLGKEDILAKWSELGVKLNAPNPKAGSQKSKGESPKPEKKSGG